MAKAATNARERLSFILKDCLEGEDGEMVEDGGGEEQRVWGSEETGKGERGVDRLSWLID